jgi:hypothetical protein
MERGGFMTPAILVFLGIIALCSLVQAVFFAGLAFASWKAAARVDDLADRAQTDLTRIADKVEGLTARLETLSRQARETLERTEPIVTKVAERAERASAAVRRTAERPFVPIQNGSALVHGLLRAVETYRGARRPATLR